PDIPSALREACRLAASPQLRSMGTVGGNLLQSTRCWYWRLKYPCRLHGGDRCHAREGEHREHAIFANDYCASAHPSDVAAALVALGATLHTTRRELSVREFYRLPTPDDRRTTTLEPGEVILELEVPPADASTYLKAMDRKRWAFPLVGVAAVRRGAETTVALAGVAPVPWLLAACGGKGGGSGTSQTKTDAAGCVPASKPASGARTHAKPTQPLDAAKTYDVVLKTNCGSFTLRLDQKQSPNAAASFVALVQ